MYVDITVGIYVYKEVCTVIVSDPGKNNPSLDPEFGINIRDYISESLVTIFWVTCSLGEPLVPFLVGTEDWRRREEYFRM